MDGTRSYLAGDIHSLGKVNRIVPRKMELPLLMQSRIQIRKNLFGIKSRFFEHMKSYDYKFKSLAAEPKQVIRALRSKSANFPRAQKSSALSTSERTLADKSSAWKLPPNVYRLKDNFDEVCKKQMGRLGPYQCFTLEREAKTVKNHLSPKPHEDECDIFYDVPSSMSEKLAKPCNRYKSKFLKGERFEKALKENAPPPTKYYPQNFVLKPKASGKSKTLTEKPLFYYPNTTVPVKEMLFNKDTFFKPPPGRYEPENVASKCYSEGHRHVFESNIFRLVRPVVIDKRRIARLEHTEELFPKREREPRELFSFRLKRSMSLDDIEQSREREIRYNTVVKRRNVFSVKTGRPVAFLSAAPRFKSSSEVSLKLENEKRRMIVMTADSDERQARKPITKKRLAELATPKNPREKITSSRSNVFEPLPSPKKSAKKLSIVESSGTSEVEPEEEIIGNASVVYKAHT